MKMATNHMQTLTDEEMQKLKAVTLYIIDKCRELDYFRLFKILYFADREHYAKYGRRIIKDTFCALPNGPVPTFLYDTIKSLLNGQNPNIISDSIQNSDPDYYYILSVKEKPDMDELSKSDLKCLDKSIKENLTRTIPALSKKSHDIAWDGEKEKGGLHDIDPLLMAKAGGASEDMIEYIKDNEL